MHQVVQVYTTKSDDGAKGVKRCGNQSRLTIFIYHRSACNLIRQQDGENHKFYLLNACYNASKI